MGKKANPVAIRLGYNRDWQSHWFSRSRKEYAKNLLVDFEIRKLIFDSLKHAGVAKIEIFRDRGNILIEIYSSRPGVIIGRGGEGTKRILKMIQKITKEGKVDLAIKEINNPYEWAKLIVDQVAFRLEKRIPHRKVMHQIIDETMANKKISGVKIKVGGRLGGNEIARCEVLFSGTIPSATFKKDIDFAFGEAFTKFGKIGIKVWLNKGDSKKYEIKLKKKNQGQVN
ncbi:MAG: 30S ribosomal protein S3 [Patescibacteria group bacterium]|nr:30S ribosomal protein S3 [Patescibacteria group bacterium]